MHASEQADEPGALGALATNHASWLSQRLAHVQVGRRAALSSASRRLETTLDPLGEGRAEYGGAIDRQQFDQRQAAQPPRSRGQDLLEQRLAPAQGEGR